MIELSFSKLLLLAVIALVVLGPEKLPKAARMAGAMLRRLRVGWESVRGEVERELELEEVRRAAREAAQAARSAQAAVGEQLHAARESADQVAADIASPASMMPGADAAAPPAAAPEAGTNSAPSTAKASTTELRDGGA